MADNKNEEKRLSTRAKRAVVGLIVIAALAYFLFRPSRRGPMGESVSPSEDYLTAQIVASALRMVNMSQQYMTGHPLPGYPPKAAAPSAAVQAGSTPVPVASSQPYRRDVHSKTHGCIEATFTVLDNLDSRLRYGLFANPGQYHAWIRFSSGNEYPAPDSKKDARGMAIKVMGVPNRKLLEDDGLPHADTQDFALMNATQFFIRDIAEYNEFTTYLGSALPVPSTHFFNLRQKMQGWRAQYGYFLGGFTLDVRKWHIREMILAKRTLKAPPDSLLNTQFYSVSAFKLGPQNNVKYTARPCNDSPAADVDHSDPNFLRKEMVKRLTTGSACFDFMVQLQVSGKNMPVEDTTVEWSTDDSPFIPVARLEIPSQQFEINNDLGEGLSFNPWHSLPDHRPIGVMNRIRKAVYLEVSRYRREMNGVPLCEPADWGVTDQASCESVPTSVEPVKVQETLAKPAK
jgi:catalase